MSGIGKKEILRIARERDVKFVRLWFTDILGFLKSFAITVRELEGALEEGMGFDGSSIVQITEKSDLVRRALGDHVFNKFIENKRIEWERYRAQVTDYELDQYLSIL